MGGGGEASEQTLLSVSLYFCRKEWKEGGWSEDPPATGSTIPSIFFDPIMIVKFVEMNSDIANPRFVNNESLDSSLSWSRHRTNK